MLHPHSNTPPLYIPANGTKSVHGRGGATVSDTKEDMLDLFSADPSGQPSATKRLMGRRNYAIFCVFDPEAVEGAFQASGMGEKGVGVQGAGRVSLAVDLMVQGDGTAAGVPAQGPSMGMQGFGQPGGGMSSTVKYGPVIVPNLEYGR